jgi:hypothetical protein
VLHGEKLGAASEFTQAIKTMKTTQGRNNFTRALRRLFRLGARRHDPLLLLNMSLFNFIGGWDRTFAPDDYARFRV